MLRAILISVFDSRVNSRSIGERTPLLVQRIKEMKKLKEKVQSLYVIQFAEDFIKMTEQDIEKRLQEMKNFLKETDGKLSTRRYSPSEN